MKDEDQKEKEGQQYHRKCTANGGNLSQMVVFFVRQPRRLQLLGRFT
jgi:hypothetical protein